MKKFSLFAAAAMMALAANAEMVYTDLTAADFHRWTGYDANATVADENGGGEYALNVSTGLVYGTGSVWGLCYADLTEFDVLKVVATEGTPRCMFNRPGDDGAMPVETPRDAQYQTVIDNGDGSTTYIIDLNLIKSEDKNGDGGGYAHLQAIKGANWANTTVTSLQVGKEMTLYSFGEPEWYLDVNADGIYSVSEDQAALGVTLAFPNAVLPENAECVADVMLYGILPAGAEGGIMPLSADDDIDSGFSNNPTVIKLYEEPVQVVGYVEGGVLRFVLASDDLAVGNYYAIEISKVAAVVDGVEVAVATDVTSEVFTVTELVDESLAIEPVLLNGEEQIALNTHSAVSVESAEALAVHFVNGVNVKVATFALDLLDGDNAVSLASGELSLNNVGYASFDKVINFVSGYQYKLTIKAWDTTELVDEELNVMEPIAVEEYLINGAYASGIIGEPVFGIERGQFEEDMVNLGVPVRFPELQLPFGVVAEDCTITVSASLYGVPQGNEPMPLSGEDEVGDDNMGVDGPVCLAEAQLHYANVEGGVVTAMLFPEMMELGNHYAIVLNAVTVMDAEGEIVAELPEDAYFAVDFDVVPAAPVVTIGEPEFGIDNAEFPEDMIMLGVPVRFPNLQLPLGVAAEDCDITVSASLYGVPQGNEPMPLSGEDEVGDDNMGVDGPVCLAEAQLHNAQVVGGVVTAMLFPEMMEVYNHYAIMLNAVTVMDAEGNIVVEMPEDAYYAVEFDVVPAEVEEPLEIAPAFVAGEEQIALNSHSAVSVESAEALIVNFINGPMVKYATYAIDEYAYDEEAQDMVWIDQLGGGALSLSTVGYVAFDPALTFVAGHQYVLTVKAWDVESIFDENWNMAQPIAVEEFVINGASSEATLGEVVWGIERGQFEEDMINLGVPVSFPELSLPFGVVAEESAIIVYASLSEEGAEDEDDLDPGFGLNAQSFYADAEGGIVKAMLFPEQLEVGKTYTISLLGIQIYTADLEDMLLELEADASVTFTVVPSENPVSLNGITVEGAKVMFNLNGQKINSANGVVIMNGVKALVK